MSKKEVVILSNQSPEELTRLVEFFDDKIAEMEIDEDWDESDGRSLVSLLRGLVVFLREEYLEEDVSLEDNVDLEDEVFEEEYEDAHEELDF